MKLVVYGSAEIVLQMGRCRSASRMSVDEDARRLTMGE